MALSYTPSPSGAGHALAVQAEPQQWKRIALLHLLLIYILTLFGCEVFFYRASALTSAVSGPKYRLISSKDQILNS